MRAGMACMGVAWALAGLALGGCDLASQAMTQTVTAETVICTDPAGGYAGLSTCRKRATSITYKVTLTIGAGTCAVRLQLPLNKTETIQKGRLAFVDDENWQCDVSNGSHLVYRYALTDGAFSTSDAIDGETMPADDDHTLTERTDTLKGKFDQLCRWLSG